MRECLYETNGDFNSNYRSQKHVITSQIVHSYIAIFSLKSKKI